MLVPSNCEAANANRPQSERAQPIIRPMATLYTIGHSTRTLDELISVLQTHQIETLVDIRSFPVSRRLPHFNRESLEAALPKAHLRYVCMKALGGYRKKIRDDSPNMGLRSTSFRNYADYMLTAEFAGAINELIQIGERSRSAYMCAERVWFHCHRICICFKIPGAVRIEFSLKFHPYIVIRFLID